MRSAPGVFLGPTWEESARVGSASAARSVANFVPVDSLSKALCACLALKIEAAGVAGY